MSTEKEAFKASPQVPPSHYVEGYDSKIRWSSYWEQIQLALNAPEGPIAEIGVGTGVVAEYLRRVASREVTTIDIDPRLKPDVVADIVSLPFDDKSFACVMACEVLEHMPFESSIRALKELNRVSKTAIVSIPHSNRLGELGITINLINRIRSFTIGVPRPVPLSEPRIKNQHYWEIGIKNYPMEKVVAAIEDAGWTIISQFRNQDNSFHHFFYLEAN